MKYTNDDPEIGRGELPLSIEGESYIIIILSEILPELVENFQGLVHWWWGHLKILLNDMQLWVWVFFCTSEHQKRCLDCCKQPGTVSCELMHSTELSDSVCSMMKQLDEIHPDKWIFALPWRKNHPYGCQMNFCSPLTEKSPVWMFERDRGGIWPSDYPKYPEIDP